MINIGIPSKGRLRNNVIKIFKNKKMNLISERGERDLSFNACQDVVPPETKGYCTVTDQASCTYTSKEECDGLGGDFDNQRCASCQ